MRRLLQDKATRFGGGDLATYFQEQGLKTTAQVVDRLLQLTLATSPPAAACDRLEDLIDNSAGDRSARIARAVHALAGLPEFQLS